MSINGNAKGKAGEREIAALLRQLTGLDVTRRVRTLDGDSDLMGIKGWTIEVKRHKTAKRGEIRRWWEQCVDQAANDRSIGRPVLFFRANQDEWRAVWAPGLSVRYEMTLESGIECWCRQAGFLSEEQP